MDNPQLDPQRAWSRRDLEQLQRLIEAATPAQMIGLKLWRTSAAVVEKIAELEIDAANTYSAVR
jgi:hypothetical protein